MWQLRRREILQKALIGTVGNRNHAPLLSVTAGTVSSSHLHTSSQLTYVSYRSLHLATSIHALVNSKNAVTAPGPGLALARSESSHFRHYHSTKVMQLHENNNHNNHDNESSTQPGTGKPAEGGDDGVPDMQKNNDNQDSVQYAATSEPPHPTEIAYAFTPPPALSPESMAKVDNLFKKIIWLDMIEVHLLTQLVQEKMGGN
mmetsp:Transcript_43280/g.126055  ORF Transcript_43280/g.126055 Transcript_43280/m.126055 type:complete len:202 (+) Transcript_43280:130-735(+)